MITSFANKETEKLFATGKSKKLPADIIARAIMRLTQLDNVREVSVC
jgi:proteic killer suppression protein